MTSQEIKKYKKLCKKALIAYGFSKKELKRNLFSIQVYKNIDFEDEWIGLCHLSYNCGPTIIYGLRDQAFVNYCTISPSCYFKEH